MSLLTTVRLEAVDCYWDDFFTEDELNNISFYCDGFNLQSGTVGIDDQDVEMRNSNIAWIYRDSQNEWIFSKIEFIVNKLNSKYFGFDIFKLTHLQYTVYNDEGSHYHWHWDMYESNPLDSDFSSAQRKVSAVLQLSNPDEYEGGDLELMPGGTVKVIDKKRGYMSVFPSFMVHRVTPLIKGRRKTLVAWFTGPDWR